MRLPRIISAIAAVLTALLSLTSAADHERTAGRASLAKVEGVVISVETFSGDGGDLTVARIRVGESEPRELSIALAPEETLSQIGFDVQVGDRLRARIFLSDEDPVLAHKVLNLTRGTMVRFRTLTRIPLWNGRGQWQGGSCRGGGGGRGHRGH